MNFNQYLESCRNKIDRSLRELLPPQNRFPEQLHEAIYYTLFAGGKRLRPILAIASFETVGGDDDRILPLACAIELIHTYSLVHDDLPAMDNDDFRRGQLTVHKKFGEAIAILTGDALLTEAFYLLSSSRYSVENPRISLQVIEELSEAAGSRGMVGGQVFDLALEGRTDVTLEMIEMLHRCKTGALIKASVSTGARIGGAENRQMEALRIYGQKVGLAFQIKDDILDVVGSRELLGKSVGKDRTALKKTYPDLIGLDGAQNLQVSLIDEALQALNLFDSRANPLREIANYCIERKN
ncbi:MAG: polyprenyl synthetase family protein [Nitrospirae bacterium]|nr:polyprenyl synthetase family protein [Nitrospirota bacterium]MBI3594828.1 polyprenyl synthetase family protein [Nitrospirota bacterium]